MAEFLEERISERIRYGSVWQDDYTVTITMTAGGGEYRSLVQPWPVRSFEVSFVENVDAAWAEVLSLYHRAYGKYAGFRLRCFDEDSTNGHRGEPTALDQVLSVVSTGVYQLRKRYGTDKGAITIGHPERVIYKPVAGTVKVAIAGQALTTGWTASTTNGRVTFAANKTRSITAITKSAQAVLTVGAGHTYVVGDSVHVSGVAGMTQINGKRAFVTAVAASTITIGLDTTTYGTYTSGGTANTQPQVGESVTGGCRFDFPVRFNSAIPVGQAWPKHRALEQLSLIEILNP